jgi:hypothetical protein
MPGNLVDGSGRSNPRPREGSETEGLPGCVRKSGSPNDPRLLPLPKSGLSKRGVSGRADGAGEDRKLGALGALTLGRERENDGIMDRMLPRLGDGIDGVYDLDGRDTDGDRGLEREGAPMLRDGPADPDRPMEPRDDPRLPRSAAGATHANEPKINKAASDSRSILLSIAFIS